MVVPTVNRPGVLQRCLEALAHQEGVDVGVVVVLRPSDDATRAVVEQFRSRLTLEIRFVEVAGLAHALQQGIEHASAEIVAFTDDDAEPWPDWARQIVEAFRADDDLGAIGGRDIIAHENVVNVSRRVGQITLTGGMVGNHHKSGALRQEVWQLKGVNMAMRRHLVAGFPLGELVRGSGAQYGNELYLCLLVRSRGFRLVYDPSIRVNHFPAPRLIGDERRTRDLTRLRADAINRASALAFLAPIVVWLKVSLRASIIGTRSHPGLLGWLFVSREPTVAWSNAQASWASVAGTAHGSLRGLRLRLRARLSS